MLGRGRGSFAPTTFVPVTRLPRGLAAADLNADGQMDLVVAGEDSSSAVVLLAGGAGAFTAKAYRAGDNPFNVALADLDGDGNLDIAVANESNSRGVKFPGEVTLLFGDGRGAFP